MKIINLKSIVTSIVFLIFIFSCQNNEVDSHKRNDYSQIGVKHNQGLDYIFNYMKQNKGPGKINVADYLSLAETATKEFMKNKYPELTREELETINSNIESVNSSIKNYASARTNKTYLYQSIITEVESSLTYNQKSYLNEVFSVMINDSQNIISLQNNLSLIENRAYKLPVEDREVVLLAIAIARESSNYWNENYKAWQNELNESLNFARTNGEVNWGIVAAGDVAAGVATGVATSTALLVPFIGWGFWAAVTGGAAVIGSGGGAIIMLVN